MRVSSRCNDAAARHDRPVDDTRCAAFRYDEWLQGVASRLQGRFADARQGGRHHHSRRHPDQRGAAQPGARRGGIVDGPHQCRDRDRRRQGAQMEGPAARCDLPNLRQQLEASRDYLLPLQVSPKTCSAASEGAVAQTRPQLFSVARSASWRGFGLAPGYGGFSRLTKARGTSTRGERLETSVRNFALFRRRG